MFLFKRTQSVHFQSEVASQCFITTGVPQVQCLLPFFLLCYTNDCTGTDKTPVMNGLNDVVNVCNKASALSQVNMEMYESRLRAKARQNCARACVCVCVCVCVCGVVVVHIFFLSAFIYCLI